MKTSDHKYIGDLVIALRESRGDDDRELRAANLIVRLLEERTAAQVVLEVHQFPGVGATCPACGQHDLRVWRPYPNDHNCCPREKYGHEPDCAWLKAMS